MNFLKKLFGSGNDIRITPQTMKQENLEQNFIATEMTRKTIQGKNFVSQYVNIHGQMVLIVGLISDHDPNFVQTNTKRPNELQPTKGQVIGFADLNEYFEDVRNIFKFISLQPKVNEEAVEAAFLNLIELHIKSFNRIIDVDLYLYIDEMVFAKVSLWGKFFNHDMTHDEMSHFWLELKDLSFEKFRDFIFITKYDFTSPLNPTQSVIKLTDLK